MIMKYAYLILLFALSTSLSAQCIANAGVNKHGCNSGFLDNVGDTISLGGQTVAIGGIAPYTYTWSLLDSNSSKYHLYASDFLSDTTAANPKLTKDMVMGDEMIYLLKVTDANNLSCYDTVKVTFSLFTYLPAQFQLIIQAGDTVKDPFGPLGGSNRQPSTYLWRPNHGMIDSTSANPTYAPTRTIAYYPIITDSAGCTQTLSSSVLVVVEHMSIAESLNKADVEVFPNPVDDYIHLSFSNNFSNKFFRIEISDMSGKVVEEWYSSPTTEVKREVSIENGLYTLRLIEEDRMIYSQKIVISK
jgi:hypothetical protein